MTGVFPKPYRFTLIGKIENHDDEILVLDHLPGGWKDYRVEWGMDNKYFGFGTKIAHNITFYKKAAEMLRNYNDNFGVESNVTLKVEKGNMNTLQYDFEAEFGVNFSEYESYQHYVVVGLAEMGLKQRLHANDKNTYDIPMEEGEVVQVEQGINLMEYVDYIAKEYEYNYQSYGQPNIYHLYDLPIEMSVNEKNNIHTINYEFKNQSAEIGDYFFKINGIGNVIKGEFKIQINADLSYNHFGWLGSGGSMEIIISVIQKYNNGQSIGRQIHFETIQQIGINPFPPKNITINKFIFLDIVDSEISFVITLNAKTNPASYPAPQPYLGASTLTGRIGFNYYGTFTTKPFSFRAYQLEDWVQKIFKEMRGTDNYNFIDKISDGGLNYLEQYRDRIMVTSADAIRGIENAHGKGCFMDFYDAITGVLGCGAAIDGGKMYFLPKERIFDPNTELANIGSVSRIKVSPFIEWIKNRFKFGYPNKDYDKLNGRHEFNTTVEFVAPFKFLQAKEQSFVGKYRADSFGIQWLRWEYSKKASNDSRSDNDMFFVVVRNIDGKLIVEQNIDANSIENDIGQKGLFNFFISPKRNMMRNGSLLSAYCDKLPVQDLIRFTSSEKVDSKLVSQIPFEETFVDETKDVPIFELPSPLFKPLLFEFDSAAQFCLPQNMMNPHGFIRFNYYGLELKGFVYDIHEATTPAKAQEFKLIAHPDTPPNVSSLISEAGSGKTAL